MPFIVTVQCLIGEKQLSAKATQTWGGHHYTSAKILLGMKVDSSLQHKFSGVSHFYSLACKHQGLDSEDQQNAPREFLSTQVQGKMSMQRVNWACSLLHSWSRNPSMCCVLFIISALHQGGNIHTEPRGLKAEALEKPDHIRHIQLFSIPTPHTCFYLLFLG